MCDMSKADLLWLFEEEFKEVELPTEDELTSAIDEIQGRTDNFYNEVVNEVLEQLREGKYKEEQV
jgi:hypothetical protein